MEEENTTIRYHLPEDSTQRYKSNIPEQPTIRYSDSKIISQLPSSGGEADIAIIENEGKKFIRKLYRYGIIPKEKILKEVQRISDSNRQYFIIQYDYGYDSEQERWYEILEYAPHNSLREILSIGRLSKENINILLSQISSALSVLHKNGIVHLDLKPSNILIRSLDPFIPVVADFGISSILDPEVTRKRTELKGTFSYWAPEQMSGIIGTECDYWSLGVVLYEGIVGQNPFSGLSQEVVLRELATVGITVPDSVPEDYALLLKGLLTKDPKGRWGKNAIECWLKGETPPIEVPSEPPSNRNFTPPYTFEERAYQNIKDLVSAFAENPRNWESAKKHLNRGNINSWLQKNDAYDLDVKVATIKEDYRQQDLQIILLIGRLNPVIPFTYKSKIIDLNNLFTWKTALRLDIQISKN